MQFKTVKSSGGILKPESLTQPLIGYYRERRPGQFSPIHVIEDLQNKIHQVRGCKTLDDALINVPFDTLIQVVYVKSVETRFGRNMIIMSVGTLIVEESEESPGYDPDIDHSVVAIKDVQHNPDYDVNIPDEEERLPEVKNRLARFGIK